MIIETGVGEELGMVTGARPRKTRAGAEPQDGKETYRPPLTISHRSLLTKGSDIEFRETIYLMIEILRIFDSCNAVFGRALGIAGTQFSVLIGVAFRQGEEGITISRLAKYIQLSSTQVTMEVSALVRQGLLVKRAGTHDRRSVLVMLSPAGQDAIEQVVPLIRKVNDLLFDGVSHKQMLHLKDMFAQLSKNSEFMWAEIRLYEREHDR